MKTKKTKWKQYLAFMLAVVMTLTSTDLSMAASGRTGRLDTESTVNQITTLSDENPTPQTEEVKSITEAALVASNYSGDLTDAEKAILNSGKLAGDTINIKVPNANTTVSGNGLVQVSADDNVENQANVTVLEYTSVVNGQSYVWKPVKAEYVYNTTSETEGTKEVRTPFDLSEVKENGESTGKYTGTFTCAVNDYSVEVQYQVYVDVDEDLQATLLNAPSWLATSKNNVDTIYKERFALMTIATYIDELRGYVKEKNTEIGYYIDADSDVGKAIIALYEQCQSNNESCGKKQLDLYVKTYNYNYATNGKVKYILDNGSYNGKDIIECLNKTWGYFNTISSNDAMQTIAGLSSTKAGVKEALDAMQEFSNDLATLCADPWTAVTTEKSYIDATKLDSDFDTYVTAAINKSHVHITENSENNENSEKSDITIEKSLLAGETTITALVNRVTVDITVQANVWESGKANPENTVSLDSYTAQITVAKGSSAEDVINEIANCGIEATALNAWDASYGIGEGNYDKTVTALGTTVEEDTEYYITYTPHPFTVTSNCGLPTSLSYGYTLELPKCNQEENPGQSYLYTITDAQGKKTKLDEGKTYRIESEITVARELGKARTSYDINDVVAEAYADVLSSEADEVLKNENLKNTSTILLRVPDESDNEGDNEGDLYVLQEQKEGETTKYVIRANAYDASADTEGIVWVPSTAKLYDTSGKLVKTIAFKEEENGNYGYVTEESFSTDFGYAEIFYGVDVASLTNSEEVWNLLNLPNELESDIQAQRTEMAKMTGNLYVNLAKLTTTQMKKLNLVVQTYLGAEAKEAFSNIWTYCMDGTENDDKSMPLLYDYLTEYKNNGMAYYYSSYYEGEGEEQQLKTMRDAIQNQVDLLYTYLNTMVSDPNFSKAMDDFKDEQDAPSMDSITKLLEGLESIDLPAVNSDINIERMGTYSELKTLVDALDTAKGKTKKYDVLPHTTMILQTSMKMTAPNRVNWTMTVQVKDGKGTVKSSASYTINKEKDHQLDQTEVDEITAKLKDLKDSLNIDTNHYEETISGNIPSVGSVLSSDSGYVSTWSPASYSVIIMDKETNVSVGTIAFTYDAPQITLEACADAGYQYIYKIGTEEIRVRDTNGSIYSFNTSDNEQSNYIDNLVTKGTRKITITRETVDLYRERVLSLVESLNEGLASNENLVYTNSNGQKCLMAAFIPYEVQQENGSEISILLRISPSDDGIAVEDIVSSVAQAIMSSFSYIGVGGEALWYKDENGNSKASVQSLIDAVINSGIGLQTIVDVIDENGNIVEKSMPEAAQIVGTDSTKIETVSYSDEANGEERTKVTVKVSDSVIINDATILGGELIQSTLQLGDTADSARNIPFYVTLEDFDQSADTLQSLRDSLLNVKDAGIDIQCVPGTEEGAKDSIQVKLTLADSVYDIFMAAMLMTGQAELSDINKLSLSSSLKYLMELIRPVVTSEKFTKTLLESLLEDLNQKQEISDSVFNWVKKLLTAILDQDQIAFDGSSDGATYTGTATYSLKNLLESDKLSSYEQFTDAIVEKEDGITLPIALTLTNMEQPLQAWIVDTNAEGLEKIHFVTAGSDESGVSNLKAALKTAGEGTIVTLLDDVTEDITISKSMTLNLNGKTITGSLTADGCTVTIVDSTLDTTKAGAVTESQGVEKALIVTNDGAFKVTAGKYSESVIEDSWLPDGYSQNSEGYVTNSLYTITVDDGNIVLNVLATFLETSTIPNIRTMVQDLAYDLILNFYTAASFRVTTSNGTRSIYTIDFDNALSMVKDGKSDLLNEVIGKISVDGVNALANDLIATLTDFKTLGTASGTEYTIASYTLEQATWDVNLSVDKVDPENTESDYYVNVQITPKTKTTQMTDDETGETTETKTCDWSSRKFTVQIVDPDENGTNMAELATLSKSLNEIVTIKKAELSVTGISYKNGDLQVTGDSTNYTDGRLATVNVTVNLSENVNYPQILAVVIANNGGNSKDALVAAIKGYQETGDISALKKAIEGVTSAELFSALKNAKGKTFSQMLSNLGIVNDDAKDLESIYDKMLNVLYVLISKLGLEGSGAKLGSKKDPDAPGTYQVSGMKKSICAELTIKLFTNGSVSAVDEKGNVKYDGEDLTAALTAVAESGGVVKVTTGEKTLKSNVTVTGEVSISGASNIKFGNGYYIYLGKSDATITADGALGYKASNGVFMSGVKLADSMDSTVYELPEPDGAGGSYVYALNVKMPTVEPTVNKGSGSIIKGYSVEESTVQESEHKEQVEGQIFLDVDPSNGITVRQLDALAFEVEAQGSTMTIVDKDGKPLGKDAKLGTGAQITIKATNTAEDPADTTQTITKEKTATYTIIIMGDLDGDGKSGAFDASLLLQYSVGKRTLSDAQQQAADIDGNGGGPYAFDASKILRKSVYEWNDGTYKTALK